MHERAIRRAVALGAAALLLAATTALADSLKPTGDGVILESNGNVDLGDVAAGQTLAVNLAFKVVCSGSVHVDPGSSVTLTLATAQEPSDGTFISVSDATVGPAPGDWPSGGGCTYPVQSFGGGTLSHVVITAPTTAGPASYLLSYSLSGSPSYAFGSLPYAFATLDLTVVTDQPPVLHLPAPMTVEGNTTGGAIVGYTATATDSEDSPPPTPTCSPTSGAFFALGTTSVGCSVTDSFGHTVTGSFDVTIVDTTAPTLSNVPGGLAVTTYDSGGATATWPLSTAADVVDPSPNVACDPASGSVFPVGSTTVTCTATDGSGNHASAAFDVTVSLVRLAATFDAPIGPSNTLSINPGRTLPVKASITRDGATLTAGDVGLALTTCGGVTVRAAQPLAYQGDRWFLGLDTTGLTGCVTGTLLVEGHRAATFTMDAGSGVSFAARRHR